MKDWMSPKEKLVVVAHMMRVGHLADANACLPIIMDETLIAAKPLKEEDAIWLEELMKKAFQAQEKHDWLSMADYLEYELTTLYS
ncbi:hypothetical protein [Endozoicomonas numazuensis]|uniref:Uncharacterized protein n=1 Tax=Endozoicomonas numazuensis TaxID=1137799 RepID=A0A081ND11_9GAMM|nr:hypothetical protein [Endozoicomonas numazuensis]KEQ16334.1 hypothetical protein GZ78_20850 [Endozoicomonas numazuensis]